MARAFNLDEDMYAFEDEVYPPSDPQIIPPELRRKIYMGPGHPDHARPPSETLVNPTTPPFRKEMSSTATQPVDDSNDQNRRTNNWPYPSFNRDSGYRHYPTLDVNQYRVNYATKQAADYRRQSTFRSDVEKR